MGRLTGSPFVTNERCAACNTFNTRSPLAPSVSGGRRLVIASRNAWHS